MELAYVIRSPIPSRHSAPVFIQAGTDSLDASDGLVTQDYREQNRQLTQPQMYIRTADPRHFDPNQAFSGPEFIRQRILTNLERLLICGQNRGTTSFRRHTYSDSFGLYFAVIWTVPSESPRYLLWETAAS